MTRLSKNWVYMKGRGMSPNLFNVCMDGMMRSKRVIGK